MSKFRINYKGFIITLLDTNTGDKITMYVDLVSWKDAAAYATKMLTLNCYRNCGLYQITRCVSCDTERIDYYGKIL